MPRRSLLLVPSKTSPPSWRLRLMPFSLWKLPTGTTTLELVTSGRSVAIGEVFWVQLSAAAAIVAMQTLAGNTINTDKVRRMFMRSPAAPPARRPKECPGRTPGRLSLARLWAGVNLQKIANSREYFRTGILGSCAARLVALKKSGRD